MPEGRTRLRLLALKPGADAAPQREVASSKAPNCPYPEARPGEQLFQGRAGKGVQVAGGIEKAPVWPKELGIQAIAVGYGEGKNAVRPQDAAHLDQALQRVVEMLQDTPHRDQVEVAGRVACVSQLPSKDAEPEVFLRIAGRRLVDLHAKGLPVAPFLQLREKVPRRAPHVEHAPLSLGPFHKAAALALDVAAVQTL